MTVKKEKFISIFIRYYNLLIAHMGKIFLKYMKEM